MCYYLWLLKYIFSINNKVYWTFINIIFCLFVFLSFVCVGILSPAHSLLRSFVMHRLCSFVIASCFPFFTLFDLFYILLICISFVFVSFCLSFARYVCRVVFLPFGLSLILSFVRSLFCVCVLSWFRSCVSWFVRSLFNSSSPSFVLSFFL